MLLDSERLTELGIEKINGNYAGFTLSNGTFYDSPNMAIIHFTKNGYCDPIKFPWIGAATTVQGEHQMTMVELIPINKALDASHQYMSVVKFQNEFFRMKFDPALAVSIGLQEFNRQTLIIDGWVSFYGTENSILKLVKTGKHPSRTIYQVARKDVGPDNDGIDPDPDPEMLDKMQQDEQKMIERHEKLRQKFR